MKYEVISTGSKGNCVLLCDGKIMVDCGVPFKNIKSKLYDVEVLLLTHIHSDHIREATLKNIKKMFPHITIIGNYEVHQYYEVDLICNADFKIETKGYEFQPFECKHDVLTYGFVWEYEGDTIIYATDTSTLENAPKIKYDYMFLESNHDEKKIEQIVNIKSYGYNAYAGAKRHLSTQQCKAFYYMQRRNENSVLEELHMSSRFY